MNGRVAKRLATNPKAMMDFQMSGKVPRMQQPARTPLWLLLNSMGPGLRSQYINVRLSRALGYSSDQTFRTAEALFQQLGGITGYGDWETPPLVSRAMGYFHGKLTIEDLAANTLNPPRG